MMTFLIFKQDKLDTPNYRERIGSLYEGIKTNYKASLFYNSLFVIRRLIFALTAVFATGYPVF